MPKSGRSSPSSWACGPDRAGRYGGAGLGYVELLVAMEEMGRALLCAPYLSTAVLATNALLRLAPTRRPRPSCSPRSRRAADRRARVARSRTAAGTPRRSRCARAPTGDGLELDGTKSLRARRAHGRRAARRRPRTDDGRRALPHRRRAPTVLRARCLPTLDMTRKLAASSSRRRPRELISARRPERASRARARARGRRARGGAGRRRAALPRDGDGLREDAAAVRPSDRLLPGDQAQCADMLVAVEFAKSAAYHAAFRAAEGDDASCSTPPRIAQVLLLGGLLPRRGRDTSRSTAAWASPGSTRPISTSSARRRATCCLAMPAHHRERLAELVGI